MASFDAALVATSVANFNLIHLSSVIPPMSTVVVEDEQTAQPPTGVWGDRLYVVLAECRVEVPHEEAWAGIGWVQEESTGRGLFVEHTGHSRAHVEADIDASLESMVEARPGFEPGTQSMQVAGITCEHEPVCALVVAAFDCEPWPNAPIIVLP